MAEFQLHAGDCNPGRDGASDTSWHAAGLRVRLGHASAGTAWCDRQDQAATDWARTTEFQSCGSPARAGLGRNVARGPNGLMIFPMYGAAKTTDAYLSIPNDRVPHLDQVVSCSSRTRDCALPEDCLGYLIKYLDLKSLVSLHFSKVYMSAIFRSLS